MLLPRRDMNFVLPFHLLPFPLPAVPSSGVCFGGRIYQPSQGRSAFHCVHSRCSGTDVHSVSPCAVGHGFRRCLSRERVVRSGVRRKGVDMGVSGAVVRLNFGPPSALLPMVPAAAAIVVVDVNNLLS